MKKNYLEIVWKPWTSWRNEKNFRKREKKWKTINLKQNEDENKTNKEDEEYLKKRISPKHVFEGMKLLDSFTTQKMPVIVSAGTKESHNSCIIG